MQLGEESESTPLEFPAATGDPLRVTGLDLAPATASLGGAGEACFDERVGFAVDVAVPTPEPPGFGYSGIGVVGDWEIQPRRPTRSACRSTSTARSAPRSPTTWASTAPPARSCRWCAATSTATGWRRCSSRSNTSNRPFGAPGDFSLVYLRAPQISGQVVDTVIFSSFVAPDLPDEQLPFMNLARVLGVADLNGDGRMEVALRTWYYEGAGVTVFEFDGDGATAVMGNGCGSVSRSRAQATHGMTISRPG